MYNDLTKHNEAEGSNTNISKMYETTAALYYTRDV